MPAAFTVQAVHAIMLPLGMNLAHALLQQHGNVVQGDGLCQSLCRVQTSCHGCIGFPTAGQIIVQTQTAHRIGRLQNPRLYAQTREPQSARNARRPRPND